MSSQVPINPAGPRPNPNERMHKPVVWRRRAGVLQ
jgi:hypothetical protein